jgi:hypothetical protein
MTVVINIIGAPSVGKSTLASLLFYKMKVAGYNVEYVQEYAKKLIWCGRFEELNNQHQITKKQYELLKNMNGHVDYIITDGPLIHGVVYNRINEDNICNIEKTEKYIYKCFEEFNNYNIFLTHVDNRPYVNEGRVHTETEAHEIENLLKNILKPYKYYTYPAEDKYVDQILENIKS